MRIAYIFAAAVVAFATPAVAQTPSSERLELAQRLIDLSQGTAMKDIIGEQMQAAFAKSEMPTAEREWLTANITATVVQVADRTFAEMTDDVAALFTTEELRAAVAFYDSPVGQSFANKSITFNIRMQETMMPLMVEGMTGLMEKYCARFDCEAEETASRGKARN